MTGVCSWWFLALCGAVAAGCGAKSSANEQAPPVAQAMQGDRQHMTKAEAETIMVERSDEELEAAIALAAEDAASAGKRVLLEFVAPWCSDSREVARVMKAQSVVNFVDEHFELVVINVGRFDRHKQWLDRYQIKKIATFVIFEPGDFDRPILNKILEPISNDLNLKPDDLVTLFRDAISSAAE